MRGNPRPSKCQDKPTDESTRRRPRHVLEIPKLAHERAIPFPEKGPSELMGHKENYSAWHLTEFRKTSHEHSQICSTEKTNGSTEEIRIHFILIDALEMGSARRRGKEQVDFLLASP